MKRTLIAFFFLLNLPLISQEIGLNASSSWTDNEAVGTIPGFGLSIYQSIGSIGVRFDYSHSEKSKFYEGVLVRGMMVPPARLDSETIESRIDLDSYELFIAFNDLVDYKNFALNIALGGSIDNFSTNNFGTSSRLTAGITETKYGWQYLISLSYNKLFNLPVKPYVQFKQKFMYGTHYVTDAENIFEGDVRSHQLQAGVYYIFGK
jgi:opacity protein-like surface antigen